jgi:predicted O-methyltransferase YrrM
MALKYLNNNDNKIVTIEIDPVKVELASINFKEADLLSIIDIIETDAKKYCQRLIKKQEKFDFFFLDAEKEDYLEYFGYIQQLAKKNSVLFADNVISHGKDLVEFITMVELDKNSFCTLVPIGKGIFKILFQ